MVVVGGRDDVEDSGEHVDEGDGETRSAEESIVAID